MKIRNKTSSGRTIAATNQTVPPDGTVDVSADLGKSLCEQEDVWEQVKTIKKGDD